MILKVFHVITSLIGLIPVYFIYYVAFEHPRPTILSLFACGFVALAYLAVFVPFGFAVWR